MWFEASKISKTCSTAGDMRIAWGFCTISKHLNVGQLHRAPLAGTGGLLCQDYHASQDGQKQKIETNRI